MLRGADVLANAVKVTLGPIGRTVAIGPLRNSKNRITVVNVIERESKLGSTGAQMVL